MDKNASMPMLFPIEPDVFWVQIRQIIKEEIDLKNKHDKSININMDTPGMTQKPLYKISELCAIFNISRTTIYEWVKHGKLKRVKIRSRVYFLGTDVQNLLK